VQVYSADLTQRDERPVRQFIYGRIRDLTQRDGLQAGHRSIASAGQEIGARMMAAALPRRKMLAAAERFFAGGRLPLAAPAVSGTGRSGTGGC